MTLWPEDARRDRLIGDWHLYQRTGGHRTSTDDVITAWQASRGWEEPPDQYLDLGCGIGSVLLTVVHRLRPRRCIGVEAQAQSVQMVKRTIAELPSDAPEVEIHHSDFREFNTDARFPLITGSPPYFPVDAGVLPSDPQRLACRFETRGGVEAYCEAAARLLRPNGRFHLVFQTQWDARVLEAARGVGLFLTERTDFWSHADRKDSFLTVYGFSTNEPEQIRSEKLSIRDSANQISEEYASLRHELGYTR